MQGLLRKIVRDERGTVLVLVALGFTALLGFAALAVDTGVLYLEHTRLSRAADAAALAGAQELPDTVRAETVARDYALRNGIDPLSVTVDISPNRKEITVVLSNTVNLHFARTFGFESKTLTGQAKARISPVREMSGLIPLGINEILLPLSAGSQYMIKGGSQDGHPWRGIIEYPGQGNGGSAYRELAREGYDGVVAIGDLQGKVPGNKSGPTEQGIQERIDACADECTWDNYLPGCPRVALVPIYRDIGSYVEVIGFAAVFLERVGMENGKGNDNRVFATYINHTVSGKTDDSLSEEASYLNSVKLFE